MPLLASKIHFNSEVSDNYIKFKDKLGGEIILLLGVNAFGLMMPL